MRCLDNVREHGWTLDPGFYVHKNLAPGAILNPDKIEGPATPVIPSQRVRLRDPWPHSYDPPAALGNCRVSRFDPEARTAPTARVAGLLHYHGPEGTFKRRCSSPLEHV